MSIKSGRGRLSSTNSLTEKILRNCPVNTQLGHLPAKAQLPKAQQPSVLSPISNQSHGTAAISEICSQSRKSVAFWCGKHQPSGEPFNRAGLGRKNHDVRDAPAAFAAHGLNGR